MHYFLLCLFFTCQLAAEQTLALIKPNAVMEHHIGEIIAKFEKADLHPVALKMLQLTPQQAGAFYGVHKDRPFYLNLVTFMSSGPIVAIVLQGDDAVIRNREVLGATDPKKAAPGTIRADFGQDVTRNAVHGSDSVENAKKEISFFFSPDQIIK